ncbi:sugar phosphate nucleotidyltransferase [Alphaproteobacteria bacterium]|jgi:glucose-1-phosphate thymidylyltransferase|nr:sugar phosphate nucleotidyltransferase [Alphaproteobacteria bacterium]MDC0968052.1 sugar phosphate nucleotidyltransferase [Alphaproteobacteria bacterium]|tara:strand:- start:344 stop:1231 length:888 start_codon:yes stop_codon:yes gene_type:complete
MSSTTKGIILAAGKGTRLMPATLPAPKPLLPLYDKPMIYYPLEALIRMGIKDILFIVQKDDLSTFQNTFSSGEHVGLNFSYEIQEIQRGIADAYFIAENFLQKSPSVLALSDNVFLGKNYFDYANQALDKMKKIGGSVFGLPVPDPEKFGVIEFDVNEKIIGIEEKPSNPKSNLIIPGMYFFDSEAPLHAKTLKPSTRGELEITDLIQIYLQNNKLDLQKLDDSIVWHDTGNAEALLSASLKVKQYEIDHSLKLGSYEIAAYENNFIEINDLEKIADNFKKSDYGQSIRKYINNL